MSDDQLPAKADAPDRLTPTARPSRRRWWLCGGVLLVVALESPWIALLWLLVGVVVVALVRGSREVSLWRAWRWLLVPGIAFNAVVLGVLLVHSWGTEHGAVLLCSALLALSLLPLVKLGRYRAWTWLALGCGLAIVALAFVFGFLGVFFVWEGLALIAVATLSRRQVRSTRPS